MPLTSEQQAGVQLAVDSPSRACVLTGGPGTGKTFTLTAILDEADRRGWTVELASPTGKAAKRAAEVTGRRARTIHRLLEYSPQQGWGRHEGRPLQAQMVVVDEASMLDVELAAALLAAIPPWGRLLLVGDEDQLPSVGAGAVLRDLIASGVVPVARLTQVMRQSERSWIHLNARAVNRGEDPRVDNAGCDDFFFIEVEEAEQIPDRVARLLTDTFHRRFPANPKTGKPFVALEDFQVLVPQRPGRAGVDVLNDVLREALNPPGPAELKTSTGLYRVGDRVVQMKNDYDRSVFNGEGGRVVFAGKALGPVASEMGVDHGAMVVRVDFGEDEEGRRRLANYGPDDTTNLRPAFALTVHKSQGSEFPVVVVVCHSTHTFMLSRQILYTAITRARQAVFVVGDAKGLRRAVRNDAPVQRDTGLCGLLRSAEKK
jgi:exodeoxyribonuclease V alpha subunit